MKWVAVDAMRLQPYKCIACGSTPRDDSVEGKPNLEAYFCEGVDYDWGKSLYLCGNCVRVLGQLRGMIDVAEAEKLKTKLKAKQEAFTELQGDHEELQTRVARMLDGVRAKKEVQGTRQHRSTKKKEPA